MKRKKFGKFIGTLIALLLAVSLVACSSKDETKKSDGVTIDVFQFKVEFNDQFKALAKKYEEEHKDVKINITTVGGGNDYGAALKAKFSSGDEPSIFNIGGPEDMKTWDKYLADVSDTDAAKAALAGTLTGVSQAGKVLGLPYNVEGYGLLYNKEIFEKAGIQVDSIKTQADLRAAVELLDSKKQALGIEAVFALPAKETWVTGLHASNIFIAPEFNNDVISAYNAKTIDFKFSKQYQEYIDLMQKYSVQPTVSLDYAKQMEELFSNGKVALTQQGNWVSSTIAGIDADFQANGVGFLPVPVDGAVEGKIPVGVPNYWAVNKTKSKKEIQAAKDFLDWMYTSATGKEAVVKDFKFIPAYSGYDAADITDSLAKEIYSYSQSGNTTGWVFMGYPTDWGMSVLGAGIQKYVSNEISWDELIKEVQAKWADARK